MTTGEAPRAARKPACCVLPTRLALLLILPLLHGPEYAAHAASELLSSTKHFSDVSIPGGIVRVPVPANTQIVIANGRRALLEVDPATQPPKAFAIAAVPLDTPPGSGRVFAQHANGSLALAYRVTPHTYPVQRLTLSNQRMVDPNPEDLQRINTEQLLIDAARNRFSPTPPATLRLRAPVHAPLSSLFGSRRVLNGQPRNPHTGLDFAAPTGAPIRAPLAGEVVAIGDYFFTGNTVFVDHGQGFVTMYAHLSRVDVSPGQHLDAGELIGQVGSTGRATGPHLHWSVFLSNVPVDPKLLLEVSMSPSAAKASKQKTVE